jgi:ectoine hydroxylase-related dioxygenase (phytanoyl-CoA dioxygenase family)
MLSNLRRLLKSGSIVRRAGSRSGHDARPSPRLKDPGLEADLERDGYAIVPALLDARATERLGEVFRAYDDPVHHLQYGVTVQSSDLKLRAAIDREVKAVIWPKLEPVLNGYRFCSAHFFSKEPQPAAGRPAAEVRANRDEHFFNTPSASIWPDGEVGLHQDPTLVDESRYDSLGLWCPLTDVGEVNGCLRVVPGSHRLNPGPRSPGAPFPYSELLPLFGRRLRPVPMAAGSAMIYSHKLFHSSLPNRGTRPRLAAGGLLAPHGAQLYCYYLDGASPDRMEVYEVDDLFYTRFIYGARPEGVPRVREIKCWHAPLSARDLSD